MKKFRNVVPTEISVNLTTGFNHFEDDHSAQTREQLEYIGFYAQSLFRMVKAAIENLGDFDDKEIQEAHWDMMHTCDIGVSVASAISPLLQIFDKEIEPSEIEENEIEKPVDSLETLAAQISRIMKSPLLPPRLYDALADELAEIPVDSDSTENILRNLEKRRDRENPVAVETSETVLGANQIAERLFDILNSESAPDALKSSLFALLDAESFERGLTFNDPRIIRQSFPLLLESIDGEAARVFLSAIENLIDSYPKESK